MSAVWLQGLTDVQVAVDSVKSATPEDLHACAASLITIGVAQAVAFVAYAEGHAEVLTASGVLPDLSHGVVTGVLMTRPPPGQAGLVAVRVPWPQLVGLVLVVDLAEEPPPGAGTHQLVVEATARLLGLRLQLVDTRQRLDASEARTVTLLSATQALGQTLELRDVFTAILSQLRKVVPYDSASVQRLEGTSLRIIGGHGFPNSDEIIGLSFDMDADDNPNRAVITTRRARILGDVSALYPGFREGPHLPASIRSWLGVPLEFGNQLLGMLAIDSRQADFYDEDHARIAQAFAAQAAIAIENARMFGEMRRMATHDALTGLPNRRQLEDGGAETVEAARAAGTAVALLMCDLDHFKVINDTHGHAVGDEVLRAIASRLTGLTRPHDLLARYGGEEFVILLPHTEEVAGAAIAERIRHGISDQPFPTSAGEMSVTISIGLAASAPAAVPMSDLLREADRALYEAKAQGRNRWVVR